jgi:catechol 2,3-dioxygenase-like lactoylglutathione lyase family enzyme
MLKDSDVGAVVAAKDMETAKAFYGDKLGLTVVSEDGGGTLYQSGNGRIFVYQSDLAGTNKATAAAWSVGDIESVVADLKTKGVTFEHYDDMPGVTLDRKSVV